MLVKVWRGIKESPGKADALYQQDQTYQWAGFTSCSLSYEKAQKMAGPQGTILEIECHPAGRAHELRMSYFDATEAEVVFLPNTKVLAHGQRGPRAYPGDKPMYYITLKELPRQTQPA